MARYAMVTDVRKCVGCQACSAACSAEWDVPPGYARTHVRPTGIAGKFPKLVSAFYVAQCNHCTDPACIKPCPSGATYQADNGIVKIDRDLCIGCGFCVDACPYGARFINPKIQKADKCDFCSSRIEKGLQPACVATCTAQAKFFGDLEDRSSDVFRMVYEQGARRIESTDVTIGPNVYYLAKPEQADLLASTFPPREPRMPKAGDLWARVVKPFILAVVGASFLGQAIAFFHQLKTGERQFEE